MHAGCCRGRHFEKKKSTIIDVKMWNLLQDRETLIRIVCFGQMRLSYYQMDIPGVLDMKQSMKVEMPIMLAVR